MSKIENFEDLRCWQESRKLVNYIFDLIDQPKMSKEFELVNQLKRASVSVMTNISEGFSWYHKKDFIRFLDYAQSSTQEVKSLLYIILDRGMETESSVRKIQEQCDYCRAQILALLKHVKKTTKLNNKLNEPEYLYVARN